MSSKKPIKVRNTLALRLTLWYAGAFSASACLAFLLFYLLITGVFRQQIDTELLQQADRFETLLELRGIDAVKRMAVLEARAAGVKKVFYRMLNANGEVFSSSNMAYWRDIPVEESSVRSLLESGRPVLKTLHLAQSEQGRVRIAYRAIGPGVLLQLGQSMEPVSRFVAAFRRMFVAAMGLSILLAALVGWFIARRAVSGVEAVTQTAQSINAGDLSSRVPVNKRGDEIDQLAHTFNRMLDRIETLVTEVREMSDNIAHDLKSPITRLRGQAEVTLTENAGRGEFEKLAADTVEECDRMLSVINTMLQISRTEAGVDKPTTEQLDLYALVADACDLYRPSAEDADLQIQTELQPSVHVEGDRRWLQRMVVNLLDNAVKYTPAGGTISVRLSTNRRMLAVLAIEDTGIGMTAAEMRHAFDRFYRGDRSRSKPGSGLGLSLARAVAQSHGGDIEVHSRPNTGSTFTVRLPAASKGA
ncbi:MAG TPA: sensor histidine kinase [Desulfobacterales bacterium]